MSSVKVFPEKYKYIYQSTVVFGATLYNLAGVLSFGWASPMLPLLTGPDSPIPITVEQGTWILMSGRLAELLTPILAGLMMDKFGRMRSLLCGAVPILASWIMLALAESFELICVFSFITAGAYSFAVVVLPMYIGEISSPHIRGSLGVMYTVATKSGLLFMYAIGPFVSFRLLSWICVIPISIFIIIYVFLPESPYHLIGKNRNAEAERNLQKLRCTLDVKEELAQMEASVKESQENRGTFRELFLHPRNRRNLIVILGLSTLNQLNGSQIVLQYAQTIFATLDSGLDAKYASIIFGFVQLGAAILACFLVDTLGRRPLLLISIVLTGSCTFIIGVYYIFERYIDVSGLGWLPLLALMVFMVSYIVGTLSVMLVFVSELFPKHLKSVAGSALALNSSALGLVLVYAYQYGVDNWGSDYVFIIFSLLTFAFLPFVWFLVPETKRKTLESILHETMDRENVTQ